MNTEQQTTDGQPQPPTDPVAGCFSIIILIVSIAAIFYGLTVFA